MFYRTNIAKNITAHAHIEAGLNPFCIITEAETASRL